MSDVRAELEAIAPGLIDSLAEVSGVHGVVLGGSRARGDHGPDSDYDLGIYYAGELDIARLQEVADTYSSSPAEMTQPGAWGPWVDGGGWLKVHGTAVDVIYRDLDRVEQVWVDCRAGRYTNEIQTGHPLGFWSHAYVGELALAEVLIDRSGELGRFVAEIGYPPALAAALVARLWEASFSVANARKVVDRLDVAYVAGSLFRAVGVMAHAIHGYEHRWLVNEKGAVAAAARLASAPDDFVDVVDRSFARLRPDPSALAGACADLETLVDQVGERVGY